MAKRKNEPANRNKFVRTYYLAPDVLAKIDAIPDRKRSAVVNAALRKIFNLVAPIDEGEAELVKFKTKKEK